MKNVNIKDILILIIPVLIFIIAYPFLPVMIPRQISFGGKISYMHKGYLLLVALLPFLIYKYYKARKRR